MSTKITKEEALEFHEKGRPGKIGIECIKPLDSVRDLSLAYSPGVGFPCLEIQKNPEDAYRYTSKGNIVAVISNGTAVLGFGDIGHLAGKPVMEGKAVLMKKFAQIDGIDIEVNEKDPYKLAEIIIAIGDTFGGINLEDIKAPECFIVEKIVKERLNIPVMHDDQHGTAVVSLAALINVCKISKKNIEDVKIVVNGAGAAGIACTELFKYYGFQHVVLCDTKGVIYDGRTEGMNEWKSRHAIETNDRTLLDATKNADILIGLSQKGAFTEEMIRHMAANPLILAMANPEPEMLPDDIKAIRHDAIVGTGRSDFANQVNNVMCFPFVFRAALDVKATKITESMKLAAAIAIASLAELDVSNEMKAMYPNRNLVFGSDYIIPVPFDHRLYDVVTKAVKKAAIEDGVIRGQEF